MSARHNHPAFTLVSDEAVLLRGDILSFLGLSDFRFEKFQYDPNRPDRFARFGPPEITRESDHPRGAVRWRDFLIWLETLSPLELAVLRLHQELERLERETGTSEEAPAKSLVMAG